MAHTTCRTAHTRRHPAARPSDLGRELTDGFAHRFIRHKTSQLIRGYGFTPSDREDLDQELKLRLLERIDQFDAARADWPAFVTTVIERQIATILEARGRIKRDGETVSLAEPADDDGLSVELADVIAEAQALATAGTNPLTPVERVDLSLDLAMVLETLTAEARCLCLALSQASFAAAARELGLPRTTVYARVARVRAVFAAEGRFPEFWRDASSPAAQTR